MKNSKESSPRNKDLVRKRNEKIRSSMGGEEEGENEKGLEEENENIEARMKEVDERFKEIIERSLPRDPRERKDAEDVIRRWDIKKKWEQMMEQGVTSGFFKDFYEDLYRDYGMNRNINIMQGRGDVWERRVAGVKADIVANLARLIVGSDGLVDGNLSARYRPLKEINQLETSIEYRNFYAIKVQKEKEAKLEGFNRSVEREKTRQDTKEKEHSDLEVLRQEKELMDYLNGLLSDVEAIIDKTKEEYKPSDEKELDTEASSTYEGIVNKLDDVYDICEKFIVPGALDDYDGYESLRPLGQELLRIRNEMQQVEKQVEKQGFFRKKTAVEVRDEYVYTIEQRNIANEISEMFRKKREEIKLRLDAIMTKRSDLMKKRDEVTEKLGGK